ncbi:MAG: hypothetical protein PUE66_07945 [Erysipelotrichaceae bacterium]|nr:hypothetical protein [Erysipelotrichaceae bacterium]
MENKNVKLIDKQVYEEDGLLYLSLTYEFKNIEGNNEGKYNLYIPKIALDIKTNDLPIINNYSYHSINHEENVYDFKAGTHNYILKPEDSKEEFHTYKIETKEKKMTVEEIEKELGYKVQIIGKKG